MKKTIGLALATSAGVSLAFGRVLTDKWNFEISLGGSNHALKGTDNKLKLQNWDLGLQRVFYRNESVNPITAGLGRIEASRPSASARRSTLLRTPRRKVACRTAA